MSTTLLLPEQDLPLTDPDDIYERMQKQVDIVIDGGYCGLELTTMVDMASDEISVMRPGIGDISRLQID